MKINVLSLNLKRILPILLVASSLAACNSGSSSAAPAATTTYAQFQCSNTINVSFPGLSGVRGVDGMVNTVYLTGVYVQFGASHAFVYQGALSGGGVCYPLNYPSSPGNTVTSTSSYGPDNNGFGRVAVTGSYTTAESSPLTQHGFLYLGALDGSTVDGWQTLDPTPLLSLPGESVTNVLGHSTMGGMVVGNYDTNLVTGKAFLYDINKKTYFDIIAPGGSASITAYGIWYNGGTSYTIAGGYSAVNESGINIGYITDWDSVTQRLSNFTTVNYNNLPPSIAGNHFQGITGDGNGGYNLSADWQYLDQSQTSPAFVRIGRNSNGTFAPSVWTNFYYPGSSWTSANTVYQNYVIGLYTMAGSSLDFGYVATIAVP